MSANPRPPRPASPARGFTLIEILVVLTLSLGMVLTVTQLYRATGRTLQSLRGIDREWQLQHSLRSQARALYLVTDTPQLRLYGDDRQLILPTWQSRRTGRDGPPVLARYRYDSSQRSLYYQEIPLPPPWADDPSQLDSQSLGQSLDQRHDTLLLNGMEEARFEYLANAEDFSSGRTWMNNWGSEQAQSAPLRARLSFERGGRRYEFWLPLNAQGY